MNQRSTPHIKTVQLKGLSWKIDSSNRNVVKSQVIDYLPAPPPRDVKTIKSNMARTVYSVPLSKGRRAILKMYTMRGTLEKIKYFLLPSKAATEWRMMFSLRQRSVPGARPLAWGEKRKWGFLMESYLLLEEIPEVKPVRRLLENCMQSLDCVQEIEFLFRALGKFTARVHRAGICHKDFHAGNVLARWGQEEMFLVDLHTAKAVGALTSFRKTENLAKMGQALCACVPSKHLAHYIDSYCSSMGLSKSERLLGKVLGKVKKVDARHISSRSKRCLKESSRFSVSKKRKRDIYLLKIYRDLDLEDLLARHEKAAREKSDELLKRFPCVTVTKIEAKTAGKSVSLVVKENSYAGARKRLKNFLVKSRGKRAWFVGNSLLFRGFLTPEPVILIEDKVFGVVCRSYLVARYIEHKSNLTVYTYKHLCRNEETRRRFARTLANLVRKMHRAKIYHSDLSGKNILVKEVGDSWEFYLLDLESVTLDARIGERRKIGNFTQLNDSLYHFSKDERMCFVRDCLGENSKPTGEYFKEIERRTGLRQKRRERLGYSPIPPNL